MENRTKLIMKTSIVGIIVNVFLALFKIVLGTLAHSISVLMDGVNNLADAGSSVITILGTILAGKPADKKHPFGYGRIEYFSSLIIGCLILYAGITSFVESAQGIIHPETPDYSTITLIIIAAAIIVKLALALYTQAKGKKANSDSLVASGKEAILDVFLSVTTLIAAIIYTFFGVALEAFLAIIISLIIVKAGVDQLKETISKMIGEQAEVQLVKDIKKAITEFPQVNGAFDLVFNDYGPDYYVASVHIEVDDTLTAAEIDTLTRSIMEKIDEEFSVILTAIGIYSHNTSNAAVLETEKAVRDIALAQENINGVHGFYVNLNEKKMRFDLVVSFNSKDRTKTFEDTLSLIKDAFPDYNVESTMDADFNEI